MNIHYFVDYNFAQDKYTYKTISVDISEDATLKELFLKIHEIENISLYKEATWSGNTEKVACTYSILTDLKNNYHEDVTDEDLEKKISEFPKNGPNGELSLYINNRFGIN